jgi:hypothetical protein
MHEKRHTRITSANLPQNMPEFRSKPNMLLTRRPAEDFLAGSENFLDSQPIFLLYNSDLHFFTSALL